jgi:hypothetical protein
MNQSRSAIRLIGVPGVDPFLLLQPDFENFRAGENFFDYIFLNKK